MSVHFTSILTSQLFFLLLISIIYGLHYFWKGSYTRRDVQFITVCNCLLMLRIIMPVEFPFTQTVFVKDLLPEVYRSLRYEVPLFSLKIPIGVILLCIWLAGVLFNGILFFNKYLAFQRILRYMPGLKDKRTMAILESITAGHPRCVKFKVIVMESLASPMITGLLHPKILLPAISFNDSELRYILNHETEHYYHHDLWLSAVSQLVSILYWWNPLCRYMQRNVSATLELHNDMVTTAGLSEEKRLQYLECLYKVAKYGENPHHSISFYFAGMQKKLVRERFRLLLNDKPPKKPGHLQNFVHVAAFVLILASFFVIFEPISPPRNVPGTFSKNFNTLYLVRNGTKFDLYVNGNYECTIPRIIEDFEDLPLYNSKKEVLQ